MPMQIDPRYLSAGLTDADASAVWDAPLAEPAAPEAEQTGEKDAQLSAPPEAEQTGEKDAQSLVPPYSLHSQHRPY